MGVTVDKESQSLPSGLFKFKRFKLFVATYFAIALFERLYICLMFVSSIDVPCDFTRAYSAVNMILTFVNTISGIICGAIADRTDAVPKVGRLIASLGYFSSVVGAYFFRLDYTSVVICMTIKRIVQPLVYFGMLKSVKHEVHVACGNAHPKAKEKVFNALLLIGEVLGLIFLCVCNSIFMYMVNTPMYGADAMSRLSQVQFAVFLMFSSFAGYVVFASVFDLVIWWMNRNNPDAPLSAEEALIAAEQDLDAMAAAIAQQPCPHGCADLSCAHVVPLRSGSELLMGGSQRRSNHRFSSFTSTLTENLLHPGTEGGDRMSVHEVRMRRKAAKASFHTESFIAASVADVPFIPSRSASKAVAAVFVEEPITANGRERYIRDSVRRQSLMHTSALMDHSRRSSFAGSQRQSLHHHNHILAASGGPVSGPAAAVSNNNNTAATGGVPPPSLNLRAELMTRLLTQQSSDAAPLGVTDGITPMNGLDSNRNTQGGTAPSAGYLLGVTPKKTQQQQPQSAGVASVDQEVPRDVDSSNNDHGASPAANGVISSPHTDHHHHHDGASSRAALIPADTLSSSSSSEEDNEPGVFGCMAQMPMLRSSVILMILVLLYQDILAASIALGVADRQQPNKKAIQAAMDNGLSVSEAFPIGKGALTDNLCGGAMRNHFLQTIVSSGGRAIVTVLFKWFIVEQDPKRFLRITHIMLTLPLIVVPLLACPLVMEEWLGIDLPPLILNGMVPLGGLCAVMLYPYYKYQMYNMAPGRIFGSVLAVFTVANNFLLCVGSGFAYMRPFYPIANLDSYAALTVIIFCAFYAQVVWNKYLKHRDDDLPVDDEQMQKEEEEERERRRRLLSSTHDEMPPRDTQDDHEQNNNNARVQMKTREVDDNPAEGYLRPLPVPAQFQQQQPATVSAQQN